MPTKLYLCRVEHEFMVAADDGDEARDVAQDAMAEELDVMEPRVAREITSAHELGSFRHGCPYGEDDRTCEDILGGPAEGEEGG